VCIAFGVMAIYWLAFRPVSVASARLKELGDASASVAPSIEPNTMSSLAERLAEPINRLVFEPNTMSSLAERLAEPINRLVPPSAANAQKLQKELMQAGFRG